MRLPVAARAKLALPPTAYNGITVPAAMAPSQAVYLVSSQVIQATAMR